MPSLRSWLLPSLCLAPALGIHTHDLREADVPDGVANASFAPDDVANASLEVTSTPEDMTQWGGSELLEVEVDEYGNIPGDILDAGLARTTVDDSGDHLEEIPDTELPKARVAMCVAGNSRTLPVPKVIGSLKNFTDYMRSKAKRFDLFGFTTAQGDGPKGQPHYDFPPVSSGQKVVDNLFRTLGAAAFKTSAYAREITPKNLDKHVVGRQECFSSGYWCDEEKFIRSLNYLHHIQGCLQLMRDYEVEHNTSYGYVIIARPDLRYTHNGPLVTLVKKYDGVVYQQDWLVAIPGKVAKKFLDTKRAMPLTCHKGETCCRKVQRTEDIFEYLLGARMMEPCQCKDCYCQQKWKPEIRSYKVHMVDIVRPPETPPQKPPQKRAQKPAQKPPRQ